MVGASKIIHRIMSESSIKIQFIYFYIQESRVSLYSIILIYHQCAQPQIVFFFFCQTTHLRASVNTHMFSVGHCQSYPIGSVCDVMICTIT